MANARVLKRSKLVQKKKLGAVAKGVGIVSLAFAAAFGGSELLKKRSALKAERSRQVELQREAYERNIERLRLQKIAKDEEKAKDMTGMINAAKKRGMLPRFYTRADGTQVIVDYIDPPSTQGVKRAKPVKTTQAELILKDLRESRKKN